MKSAEFSVIRCSRPCARVALLIPCDLETDLPSQPAIQIRRLETRTKASKGSLGRLNSGTSFRRQQWQQCFSEAGKVPMRNTWLISISVAASVIKIELKTVAGSYASIKRRAHNRWFARDRGVVCVHDTMDNSISSHWATRAAWRATTSSSSAR